MERERVAQVIYRAWAIGKSAPAWERLSLPRRVQWERCADAVLALPEPAARVVVVSRTPLGDGLGRLKRRAG